MRSVDEWIAASDDAEIPARVKVRIFDRCGGKCAITGMKVRPGEFEFDHIIALANGGQHRESNLQVLSCAAHKEKTKVDIGLTAKIRRQRLKNLGLWPKSKTPIRSRGFEKTRREAGLGGGQGHD